MLWSAIIWSDTQGPVKRTFPSSSMLGDFAPRSANTELAGSGGGRKAGNCLMLPIVSEMAMFHQLSDSCACSSFPEATNE